MKIAALDLGSNSFLMLICEIQEGQIIRTLADKMEIVQLGFGVHQFRRFNPEALDRAEKCFQSFSEEIKRHNVDLCIGVATSATRDVENGNDLILLGQKYGIDIKIISGELEAKLSFEGATSNLLIKEGVLVIDVGGGSTEFLSVGKDGQVMGQSVDVGSVRMKDLFKINDRFEADEFTKLRAYIRAQFTNELQLFNGKVFKKVIAVAGTPTTLACLEMGKPFDEKLVNGFKLTEFRIEQWANKLAFLSVNEINNLPGMDPKRANVIGYGTIILEEAIKYLGVKEIEVSTKGVRYGVALNHEVL